MMYPTNTGEPPCIEVYPSTTAPTSVNAAETHKRRVTELAATPRGARCLRLLTIVWVIQATPDSGRIALVPAELLVTAKLRCRINSAWCRVVGITPTPLPPPGPAAPVPACATARSRPPAR